MSSGFPFGQKPNEAPQFGQSSFGSFQFGAAASTATTTNPQFSTTFTAKPSGNFQFSSPGSPPSFRAYQGPLPPRANTTTSPSFGFGPNTRANTPAYSLGGPAPGLFSTPTTTQSTFFQTPTSIGTSTTLGYSLGGAKSPFTSAPSGGLFSIPALTSSGGQPPSLSFSTPPTQQVSGTTFGATQSSMPKMPFGSTSGISFNATPTTTTAGLSFGLTSMASNPKLSFGQPAASTPLNFAAPQTLTTSTGLNLSAPSKPTPPTGLSFAPTSSAGLTFGTPTSQNIGLNFSSAPTPVLPFGAPPPPAATTASMGLNFGTSTSAPLDFSIQPPSTATPSLGTTFAVSAPLPTTTSIPSSTAAALTFGTAPQPTTTTAAPTLSFPTSVLPTATSAFATSATASSSLSFGTPKVTSTAAASTALSFGLGGVSTTKPATAVTSAAFGLGAQPPPTPPSTVGLGGISSTPPKLAAPTTTQAQIPPKDQPLPNELLQTVDQFKKFIQEQKNFSSEIARCSIKELRKVEEDVDLVNNCINELENEMRKNRAMAEKIKIDSAKGLQNAEMAQRTFDTPAGLQYENTAPFEYFIELSDAFEKEMNELKLRIESVNRHVRNSMNPTTLNSQDLALGMRRLHQTFVALAGQLQSVHNQVEMQKEQYLDLRKTMLNDYTNVFETQSKESKGLETILSNLAKQQLHSNSSPTPFSLLRSSQVQTVAHNASTSLPTTMMSGAPITTGLNVGASTAMPLFGSTLTSASSLFNTSASNAFQLQKPPVGNKRGKP